MVISIASDHAGFELKEKIISWISSSGLVTEVVDYGTDSTDSVDYPDYAHTVAQSLLEGECNFGILICGTGNGISMSANKWQDVRTALCWNSEISILARQHNDANILSLPARFISYEEAVLCVKSFLTTEFEGGRHEGRVNKINPSFIS